MPKQSAKTVRFVLMHEHIEEERAALRKEREALRAKHQAEMDEIELKLAKLEAFETDALALSNRHAARQPKVVEIGKPKKKRASAGRAVPSGRPYTPEEDERLIAANRGEMRGLAEEMGRNYSAAGKRREVLLRKRREASSAQPVTEVATSATLPSTEEALPHDPEAVYATDERGFDVVSGKTAAPAPSSELRELVKTSAPWEPETSEKRPIVEATPPKSAKRTAARAARANSGPAIARPEAPAGEASISDHGLAPGLENPNVGEWNRPAFRREGRSVTGRLVDNGPLDQRVYDPIAHASRSSE